MDGGNRRNPEMEVRGIYAAEDEGLPLAILVSESASQTNDFLPGDSRAKALGVDGRRGLKNTRSD